MNPPVSCELLSSIQVVWAIKIVYFQTNGPNVGDQNCGLQGFRLLYRMLS